MNLPTPIRFCLMALAAAVAAAEPPRPWPSGPQFLPVTTERIASLPAAAQPPWRRYLEASAAFAAKLPGRRVEFVTPSTQRLDGPGIPGKHSKGLQLGAPKEWYAAGEAKAIADRVVAAQSKLGGWNKGNDYTQALPEKAADTEVWSSGTFDNDATTWELRFLARVIGASPDAAAATPWREAALRGVNYILAAQYPNGGFPQVFPLAGGYHDAVTYNDDAMVQALELLRDIADGRPELPFVTPALRTQASVAVARGIKCILATQLKTAEGRPTVWCQQHDAITLKPCAARNFEPVAASTSESASLARFLMSIPNPSPEIVASVQGAIAWLERTALRDIAWTREGGSGQLVAKAGAPRLWARMYELRTDKPIFGDRDRTVHYDVAELSSERRSGYAWYGTWPVSALEASKGWAGKSR